jgi:Ser/Thr protein kinase RdoA (MazF antagonist)
VFGAGTGVKTYRTILQSQDYAVIEVQLAPPAPHLLVKLAGPRAALAAPFDRTVVINRLVREKTRAPVPEVLAADVSYRDWPWRYLIMTYEHGETLASLRPLLKPANINAVHQSIGEVVAELHSLLFPAFGEVGSDGAIVDPTSYLTAILARAERRIGAPPYRQLFASVLAERADVFAAVYQAALTHEDLNPTNILLRQEGERWYLSAIVDFDSAWAGNPESDLARLDLWRGMASEAFWKTYAERHPRSPGYLERRPVLQLLWCLEYAAPTPEHRADTATVCRELGIPPISFRSASQCVPGAGGEKVATICAAQRSLIVRDPVCN